MGLYSERGGYQHLSENEELGEGAAKINEMRQNEREGKAGEPSLDEMYHLKSQLEVQLSKAYEVDQETIQDRLDNVNQKIKELEQADQKQGH